MQKAITSVACRAMAVDAKQDLSAEEYICALWARRGLAYDLIDDPMFKAQFGSAIPLGFDRKKLSGVMQSLAKKLNADPEKKLERGG